jgi:hypothetical protein
MKSTPYEIKDLSVIQTMEMLCDILRPRKVVLSMVVITILGVPLCIWRCPLLNASQTEILLGADAIDHVFGNLRKTCQRSIQNILPSGLMSKNVKIGIYKTILLPAVLYVCEI